MRSTLRKELGKTYFNQISTRRFFSRPSSVSLEATGTAEPKLVHTAASTPRLLNWRATTFAHHISKKRVLTLGIRHRDFPRMKREKAENQLYLFVQWLRPVP
jgi:hypothetical protein